MEEGERERVEEGKQVERKDVEEGKQVERKGVEEEATIMSPYLVTKLQTTTMK